MPDAAAQRDWRAALDLLARGARHCADGADTQNYRLIVAASQEFDQGTADVTGATTRLAAIAGPS